MRAARRAVALLAGLGLLLLGAGPARSPAVTATRPLKVGLVAFPGALSDQAIGHQVAVGLQRAHKELGVEVRVLTPGPTEGFVSAYTRLAEQKYDLIIGLFSEESTSVDTVAPRFPETRFAMVDVPVEALRHRPKNVRGSVFNTEEAGYLAGYLAALVEKWRPGKDVIGSVGGLPVPGRRSLHRGLPSRRPEG